MDAQEALQGLEDLVTCKEFPMFASKRSVMIPWEADDPIGRV
jgi:hypothetical protein